MHRVASTLSLQKTGTWMDGQSHRGKLSGPQQQTREEEQEEKKQKWDEDQDSNSRNGWFFSI